MKEPLDGRRIGLFMTGGIAAYKVAHLARALIKAGAEVRVAMSEHAQEFITPLTMQTLTKHAVIVDTFDEHEPDRVQHIDMADWCELAIIAPATANIIAKAACGLGDDVVSTTLLATTAPKLFVPAMNVNMYEQPATQRNIEQLRQDGSVVVEPAVGFLAEGYEGKGRMLEVPEIVQHVQQLAATHYYPQSLAGKKVIVTAGGTIERIDPVRYISNDSSGKMGLALAQAALWLGAEVELVTTKTNHSFPPNLLVTPVESAREMSQVLHDRFESVDYVVKAAAVSDYYVLNSSDQKIKKEAGSEGLTLQLAENPDILASLGKQRTHQQLIGFAAETQHVIDNAKAKLKRKQVDWIIANDVSQAGVGFNHETNAVTIIGSNGYEHSLPKMDKQLIALEIWEAIAGAKTND